MRTGLTDEMGNIMVAIYGDDFETGDKEAKVGRWKARWFIKNVRKQTYLAGILASVIRILYPNINFEIIYPRKLNFLQSSILYFGKYI